MRKQLFGDMAGRRWADHAAPCPRTNGESKVVLAHIKYLLC